MSRWVERVAVVVVSLAIAVAIIAVLSGGLAGSQDDPGLTSGQPGPGTAFRDLGDLHLQPGQPRPAYDSDPPTSGSHNPVNVTRDRTTISDDQLLQALQVGDVVLMYGTRKPPAGLTALAAREAPPFTPALAATGGAVILGHRAGTNGVAALAWTHILRVRRPNDPQLPAFIDYWLGRGAPVSRGGGLPKS
jgi:Protein of unknown function (DUF3105)